MVSAVAVAVVAAVAAVAVAAAVSASWGNLLPYMSLVTVVESFVVTEDQSRGGRRTEDLPASDR